jgi:predicted Zn-dependent protease
MRLPRLLLLLPFALTFACATNPVTGKRELALVSEAQEISMGQEAAKAAGEEMGVYPAPALQEYVSGIGMAMAKASERPSLPWSFTVLDDPVVNAFALPGGPVFITRGILGYMNSEAQMASVLGHEIGHITARHSVRQMSRAQLAQIGLIGAMIARPELQGLGDLGSQGLGLLFLRFGRDLDVVDVHLDRVVALVCALAIGEHVSFVPAAFAVIDFERVGVKRDMRFGIFLGIRARPV